MKFIPRWLVLARLKSLIVILIIQLVGKKITIDSLNIRYWGLRVEFRNSGRFVIIFGKKSTIRLIIYKFGALHLMPSPLKPKHQVQKYTKIEPKMTVKFDEFETKPQISAIHLSRFLRQNVGKLCCCAKMLHNQSWSPIQDSSSTLFTFPTPHTIQKPTTFFNLTSATKNCHHHLKSACRKIGRATLNGTHFSPHVKIVSHLFAWFKHAAIWRKSLAFVKRMNRKRYEWVS